MTDKLWIIFGFCTFFILLLSWHISVRDGRYHGIARFFSFESILLLVLLNLPVWFRHPFSFRQVVSWFLLILSAGVAILAFFEFFRKGKPSVHFETTTELITGGLYGWIRHPMYASLGLLGLGVWLKDPGPTQDVLVALNLLAVYVTARIEEREMLERFGDEYRDYMKNTKRFIPYIF